MDGFLYVEILKKKKERKRKIELSEVNTLKMQKKSLTWCMSGILCNKMGTENFNAFWFSLSIKNEK